MKTRLQDYIELTKPRLSALSLLSSAVGFYLAWQGPMNWSLFLFTIIGTSFIAAGTLTLNQWIERGQDALMERTASRPLPSGRLMPLEAFIFGVILAGIGLLILWAKVNGTSSLIGFVTLSTYLLLYTPMKRMTTLNTIVGAVPGALPPLIGWTAAGGALTFEAFILFAIIFLWQMPHFYAIAWMYRDDYKKAGFKMLSAVDPGGKLISVHIFFYTMLLIPVSLLPTFYGLTGKVYLAGASFLGLILFILSASVFKGLEQTARPIFRTSILYLTILFILMVVDKA